LSSVLRGKTWTVPFDAIDPTGADDHFVHIKNNGPRPLEVFELELFTTVAGFVEIVRCTGTATSPTAIVPVSLRGSGAAPVGLFESGVDLQMTLGSKIMHIYLAANTPRRIPLEAGLLIPNGGQIALNWDQATGILTGHVGLHEVPADEDPGA